METQPKTQCGWIAAVCKLAGIAFCVVWGAAVVAFPVLKDTLTGYAPVLLGVVAAAVLSVRRVREALNRRLEAMRPGTFLLTLLVLAVALRLAAVAAMPMAPAPRTDPGWYQLFAQRMLTGGQYGEPGRMAHYPPGMTLMLVGLYAITGPHVLAGKILTVVLGVVMVLLIHDLARLTVSKLVARWSALLAAVMPTLVLYSACLGYEILLGCILLGVCDLALRARRGGAAGWIMVVAIGLLLGFGCLVKPICLLVPGICLIGWWVLGMRWRALAYTLATLPLMAAVIAPWTARNHRLFGQFVLISTNGGEVLWSANNPQANGLAMQHIPLEGETDELSRDRLGRQAALRWMRENPGRFARLAARKVVYTWGTSSTIVSILSFDRMPPRQENACKAAINTFWAFLLVLCIVGTIATPTWANRMLWPTHMLVAYVFALHLVFEALSRHHIPVVGSLILVAAAGLARPTNTPQER